MAYLVSREARKDVTVLLSGIGGDEMLGGYRKYVAAIDALNYQKIPSAVRRGLLDPLWVGLAVTVLLLPWLALRRLSRWPAVILLVQTAFYIAIYATAPVDTALYVQTSWARLLFHLLPAVWVLAAAAVERPANDTGMSR